MLKSSNRVEKFAPWLVKYSVLHKFLCRPHKVGGDAKRSVVFATHFGVYRCVVADGRVVDILPYGDDPEPSEIGRGYIDAMYHPKRASVPLVRETWLKRGGAARDTRGRDRFVEVGWTQAIDLVAREVLRISQEYGNEAIFGGSYGWASAGRFHHAQSQLKRFLNLAGGFTSAVNTYSFGAGGVVMPHILGKGFGTSYSSFSTFDTIEGNTDLWLMFGGMPAKNQQIEAGGIGRHEVPSWLRRISDRGTKMISIGPLADDAPSGVACETLSIRPNTDTALMLALCHEAIAGGRADIEFLERYTVGYGRVRDYIFGDLDGIEKTVDWASEICGIDTDRIRQLAARISTGRTMISIAWSLQRARHGEQPLWAAVTLAAILGQIGLPGGGFSIGHGSVGNLGIPHRGLGGPSVPQGKNPMEAFIPVARISELLERPGGEIDYDGQRLTLPDIRLVYWAGGNPFHHHQDINRLVRAWRKPETVIVHESALNALADHADIILPATMPPERNDLVLSGRDRFVVASKQAVPPFELARNDHDILADVADRLGFRDAFTDGLDEMGWIRNLYDGHRDLHPNLPEFAQFWDELEIVECAGYRESGSRILLKDFRGDPAANPLTTPSGKIELFSERVAAFGYDDCPGYACWLPPEEWVGASVTSRYPLHLLSNQPATKLHSQLDNGWVAQANKRFGTDPVTMHPTDAAQRQLSDGDLVKLFNDRGACLAYIRISDRIRPGVVLMSTGAWYRPAARGDGDGLDLGGNPNVLTLDVGTSLLAQGPSANSCLVEIERYDGTGSGGDA